MVTLLSDVATNYAQYRTTAQRIKYAQENVALERKTLEIAQGEFKAGVVGELDVYQARSTLEQTEAGIRELEIAQRQYANALCTLLGIPPEDLRPGSPRAHPHGAPPEVAIGIPADLLLRRPDIRQAERLAAAAVRPDRRRPGRILSPHFHRRQSGGLLAAASNLFRQGALAGSVGPTFTWNILNYGRIRNNVRMQDAKFQELVATYQNTVLNANQEAENGLVQFLRAQQQRQVPVRRRGRRRRRRQNRHGPVLGRHDRSHPADPLAAEPGAGRGHAGAGPGRNRAGPDPGLPRRWAAVGSSAPPATNRAICRPARTPPRRRRPAPRTAAAAVARAESVGMPAAATVNGEVRITNGHRRHSLSGHRPIGWHALSAA